MKNIVYGILLATIISGCSHDHLEIETEIEHEHGSISITQFTEKTEIFMEYPSLQTDQEAEFLIHLTDLKNFSAVKEGRLEIKFTNEGGTNFTVSEKAPAKEGIYIPIIIFSEPGTYNMVIALKGKQVSDKIVIKNVIVNSNHAEIPHAEEEEETHGISFLKEQQWKIDFATSPVQKRKMQEFVFATGEIQAKPELQSKIISPIQGVILTKNNQQIKTVGSQVKKGEVLLNISPSVDAAQNIQKIKNDYLLAKSEYERVEALFKKKVATQKNLDESKFDYESKKVSYQSLIDQIKITESGYSIISPINGYIESINFVIGEQLESGQELFKILNSKKLILKTDLPSSHFTLLDRSTDACFTPEGFNNELTISELNGKRISVAASLNTSNRTIPVYFEFNNPNQALKVGMFAEVHLRIDKIEEFLAIPESAIINEDGLKTVYVQVNGEKFEKRIVKVGIIDDGYIQILEGLDIGERVVIEGAYQVRLAELSPDSAIGHGHAH